jgi:acyl carrier protein
MAKNILDRLKHLVADELDLNIGFKQIDSDMPLLDGGLKLDSLAIVELISLSEETFGIEFGEDDLNMHAFASLRTLADVIGARQAESPSRETPGGLHAPLESVGA